MSPSQSIGQKRLAVRDAVSSLCGADYELACAAGRTGAIFYGRPGGRIFDAKVRGRA